MNWALTDYILNEVRQERERQVEKFGLQRHVPEKWLAIAVEEVGELAQAMQKESVAAKPTDADSMIYEAIQGAAVLVAFAEQLLEEMKVFEPCGTCSDPEFCVTFGRLCEPVSIGDRDDGEETKKI